jgi:hypothetical protein
VAGRSHIDIAGPFLLLMVLFIFCGIGPPPSPAKSPLIAKLITDETRPLQGLTIIRDPRLGPIFPVGVRTRLQLQAADATKIIQVDRIRLAPAMLAVTAGPQWAYAVDPTKQPGFGAAKPRNFSVIFDGDTTASINYVDDQLNVHPASFPNLLPNDLLIRFDAQSGFQEALDMVLMSNAVGLLELTLQVSSTSAGVQYVQSTDPLRIYKR